MSSIRSLATITLLAIAGVFLYMKISEVDPILPTEVEGFHLDELQFGEQPSEPGAAPAWNELQPSDSAELATPSVVQQATATPFTGGNDIPSGASDVPPLPTLPSSEPPQTEDLTSAPTSTAPSFSNEPAMQPPPEFTPAVEPPPSQPAVLSESTPAQAQSSLFSATRLAVEAALDRGELSQALLLLSDWYDDPSLSAAELQEVNDLLRQLAGTVIYSTEHRLEPPYMVQAGERLEDIAKKYNVPWQLLAKINGIKPADQLQPGQQLKVLRGPFSALIDLGRHKMTLMLDRRYAGQFVVEFNSSITVEEGHWTVNQKLLTPGNAGLISASLSTATEERSLMLSSPDVSTNQLVILRGSDTTTPTASEPAGRVISLHAGEVDDVYDILSLGSRVVIRR